MQLGSLPKSMLSRKSDVRYHVALFTLMMVTRRLNMLVKVGVGVAGDGKWYSWKVVVDE
jgi:hypothetical protein